MKSSHLTVVATIQARPGKENEVREELLRLVAPTQAEDGCFQYDLHESKSQAGHFLFFENWTSAEALEKHLATAHIARLKSKEEALLAKPVEITLWGKL
ncbi:MAG: antibiotic biosynthesis monooxygenase [Deltaproteobacteria bacterium]|nr:antibiotic biosynthesis monooxygenase [Deltaproteobacteria bacterium]